MKRLDSLTNRIQIIVLKQNLKHLFQELTTFRDGHFYFRSVKLPNWTSNARMYIRLGFHVTQHLSDRKRQVHEHSGWFLTNSI